MHQRQLKCLPPPQLKRLLVFVLLESVHGNRKRVCLPLTFVAVYATKQLHEEVR